MPMWSIPRPASIGPENPETEKPSAAMLKLIGRSSGRPMKPTMFWYATW